MPVSWLALVLTAEGLAPELVVRSPSESLQIPKTGHLVSVDRNQIRNEIKRLTSGRFGWVPRTPIEGLRALSEASEIATRLGEFRRGGAD
jgi:hypothetical protein